MIIGCTKELKTHEYRVGLTPANVRAYVQAGHRVLLEQGAGLGSGFSDEDYAAQGAQLADSAAEVWAQCHMLIKVKEPEPEEFQYLRENLILYTYLHLAAFSDLAHRLLETGVRAVAYETIQDKAGHLPCLRPMSEIAGRLSVQEGAKYLEYSCGGRGVLLGGVPGVARGRVCILGGGTAGAAAAKIAVGMGAEVAVLDTNLDRLAYLDDIFGAAISTLYSDEMNIVGTVSHADLVIATVLIPGASAPKLIRREHLRQMKRGAVIVDVAIDQGGCCESSRVTYHDNPVYVEEGVIHYCVGNMPGAVPHTSTLALTNATLHYGLEIANHGLEEACRRDRGLIMGVNTFDGKCTNENVARSLGLEYKKLFPSSPDKSARVRIL